MSTDPDQIRTQIATLLADLPDLTPDGVDLPDDGADAGADLDVEAIAARLEEAHDLLVRALESVEQGPAR